MPKTLEEIVFTSIQNALAGPLTGDIRQKGSPRDRLEFTTDMVCSAVRKEFKLEYLVEPTVAPIPDLKLEPGHGVVIHGLKKAGGLGEQYAHVLPKRGRTRGTFNHSVRVWRPAQKKWTKPRKLMPGEIIRKASDQDMRTFKPEFGLAWEKDYHG